MALSTTNTPELTAEQVQKVLITPLEEKSVFLAAGPRIFNSNGSPIRIPKLTGEFTPEWVGENELIPTEDELEFGEVTLLPSSMRSVKTLTRFSNELARQSVVSLDATLRDRLVADVAAKIDTAFLGAGGDGITTPRGVKSYAGTKVDVAGEITLDDLLDAWGIALAANVNTAALRVFMSPQVFVGIRKLKDGDGNYVVNSDVSADASFRLFGMPITITSRVNGDNLEGKHSVVIADMSQIAVARDLDAQVKILSERFADYDQQAIRVVSRFDAAPLNEEGIVVLNGITV